MTAPTYSIRNWNEFYENSRSRTVKDLSWVPVPNKHDGETFAGIMAAENGAEIYSAWILILQVASKCNPRGKLVKDNGTPHDARSLSVKTRAPEKWFSVALQYLAKETDWLLCEGDGTLSGSCQAPVTIPSGSCQLSAEERREGKGIEGKENTPPQTPPAKPKRTSDESPEFLSFWEAYPRKESKPQAERAFRKAMKLTTLSEILKAIERFREVWKQSDPRYTPLPASWLNGHRWNDEPAKPSQPTQSGKPNWLRIKELKEIIRQLEGQLHSHMDRERNPGKLEQLKAAQAELAKLEPQL